MGPWLIGCFKHDTHALVTSMCTCTFKPTYLQRSAQSNAVVERSEKYYSTAKGSEEGWNHLCGSDLITFIPVVSFTVPHLSLFTLPPVSLTSPFLLIITDFIHQGHAALSCLFVHFSDCSLQPFLYLWYCQLELDWSRCSTEWTQQTKFRIKLSL